MLLSSVYCRKYAGVHRWAAHISWPPKEVERRPDKRRASKGKKEAEGQERYRGRGREMRRVKIGLKK